MASSGGMAFGDFLVWWGDELRGLVPFARDDRALRRTRYVVTAERDGGIMVSDERARASSARADGAGGLDTLPRGAPVALRVPFDACFVRQLTIPAAARRDAARLAALDLERATPFRAADILTGIVVGEGETAAAGRLAVTQFVLKRDRIAGALAELELRGHPVIGVGCWAPDRSGPMPVLLVSADVRDAATPRAGRRAVLTRLTWGAAAAASLAALAIVLVKHENALATVTLDATSARAAAAAAIERRQRAEAVSARAGALVALRAGRPFAAEILDEITRLVPDDAYLTELAIEGGEIEMSGLAGSPARLVEAFERSRLFADARFSSPSRFDPREERERFSLRVRLRGGAGVAAPPAAGGGPSKPGGAP